MPDLKSIAPKAARLLATLVIVVVAIILAWYAWRDYVYSPWTRDARVQANVVNIAPKVSGTVVNILVQDNDYVHKGELLFQINPTRFKNTLAAAKAALAKAKAAATFARQDAEREKKLRGAGISTHDYQQALAQAKSAAAAVALAQVKLTQAQQHLDWTTVASPVTGHVTHLTLSTGEYVQQGQAVVTVVEADSFHVVGYFEETKLAQIQVGDPADIELMAGGFDIKGHVAGIGRGIAVTNNMSGERNLPSVSPTFQWVRLAQRIPVTIKFDEPVNEIPLVVGLTATIHIHPQGH